MMKHCPHCGEPLEEGAAICPNCGKYPDLPPEKQKNKKSWLLAGGIVAALLILVGVAVFLMGHSADSPSEQFVSYQKSQLVEYPLAKVDTLSKKVESGAVSTDVSVSVGLEGMPQIDELLRALSLELKVDAKQAGSLVNAELDVMGTPVLQGIVTYDQKTLGFQFPELDPGYYTVDLPTLAQRAADMGETNMMVATGVDLPLEELSALFERYAGVLLGVVNEDNVTLLESETVDLPHLDAKPEGLVLVFEPKGQDVEAVVLRFADAMEKDQELPALLEKVSKDEALLAILDEMDYEVADALREYSPETYRRMVEAVRAQAAPLGAEAEKLGFRWSLGIAGNQVCLQRFELGGLGLDMGMEKTEDGVVLYADAEEDSEVGYLRQLLEYRKNEQGFSVRLADAAQEFMRFDYKRPEGEAKHSSLGIPYGEYRLFIPYSGVYHMVVAAGEAGGTDHHLELPLGDIAVGTIDIHSSDTASTAQQPTAEAVDITDYSPEEVAGLLEGMSGELQSLIGEIAPIGF